MNEATNAADEFADAFEEFANWAAEVTKGQKTVEATRALMQKTQNPNEEPGGQKSKGPAAAAAKKVVSEIDRAQQEFVAAINDIGASTVTAIRASKEESRRVAQNIKQSNNSAPGWASW